MSAIHVFTPAYFDTENFEILRNELGHVLNAAVPDSTLFFYLIDDSAGIDSTVHQLKNQNTTLISTPTNLGHQRALVHGLRMSEKRIDDGDIVITLDADGEDKPEDAVRLIKTFNESKNNLRRVVLAQRMRRMERPPFRLAYLIYKRIFRALTGTIIRTGNFVVTSGWVIRHRIFDSRFDLCFSSTWVAMNENVLYVPCDRGRRYRGQSKMNYSRLFIHGLRMLMPFLDVITVRCMIFFGVVLTTAVMLWFVILYVRLFTSLAIPGWATYALLMVSLMALMSFSHALSLFIVYTQMNFLSMIRLERDDFSTKTS